MTATDRVPINPVSAAFARLATMMHATPLEA
jgi:hypothetical protein